MLNPAYVAGFIDGEGTISFFRKNPNYGKSDRLHPLVHAVNCNPAVILALKAQYGGCVRVRQPHRLGLKVVYEWRVVGSRAVAVVRDIAPHLMMKTAQAEAVLEWSRIHRPRCRPTDAERQWERDMKARMHALNRGRGPTVTIQ